MSEGAFQDPAIASYAQALFNAGKAQRQVAALMEGCRLLLNLFEAKPEYLRFLEGPQISPEKKRKVTDAALKGRISPIMTNLLYMMIDRERAAILPRVLDEFQEIAERAEGIYPAKIASARELGFQEKQRLKEALERFTGCQLKIRYLVRPELLGGIVFRFKDKLVDGSVRHGLREIRDRFGRRDATVS